MRENTALKEAFDRDGFVHVPGFFTLAEVDAIEHRLDRYIREVVPILPRNRALMENYDRPETLKQLISLQDNDPFFAQLLTRPETLELARILLDDVPVPREVGGFLKPPRIGKPTPAHQDGFYFCLVPNEAVTVWIALNDTDLENGALRYVKGSHKHGVLPHAASGVLGFSQGLEGAPTTAFGEEVACPVRRGDVLVHHSLTIHSAPGNVADRPRRSIGLVYYAQRAQIDEAAQRRYHESVVRQQRERQVL